MNTPLDSMTPLEIGDCWLVSSEPITDFRSSTKNKTKQNARHEDFHACSVFTCKGKSCKFEQSIHWNYLPATLKDVVISKL